MSLKSSFAVVLRALRNKRTITQRDFGDTSRTFLSKLEGGKSTLTLDKLEQVSQRLELSPLTLLTLTLSLDTGKPAAELIEQLRLEIESLEWDGGLPRLEELNRPSGIGFAQKSAPDIREWSNPCHQSIANC